MARTLPALAGELAPGDELIVVDNESGDGTPDAAREAAPKATVVETGANLGYGGASNIGAARASGDLLVFLNPDAVVEPGFRAGIVAPLEEGRGWTAWQALVTARGGSVINTIGGVVHFTGIAWAGRAGEPLDLGRLGGEANGDPGREPGFVSGACLAIRREDFERLGGFPEEFFLYEEDVDLSLRVRLEGGHLGVATGARVDHDYDFEKGPAKWRYLERNRWAMLVRTYPAALLALLMPALVATDLFLWPVALLGGWWRQRLLAFIDTLRWLPRLLSERRRIQRTRSVSAGEFAAWLQPELDSSYLGAPARWRALRWGLRAYWSAVCAVLRSPG